MEDLKHKSERNEDGLPPNGCRTGCLSMLGLSVVFLLLTIIGSSPRNYRTYQKYRPDKKDNIIEEETGIAFPSFSLKSQDIYDDGLFKTLGYTGKLEFDEIPDDRFYLQLDSLCSLGIIEGKARHENRKQWKHYSTPYNPELPDEYRFKHIIRDRKNENRVIIYRIDLEKGKKDWILHITEGYKDEFSSWLFDE